MQRPPQPGLSDLLAIQQDECQDVSGNGDTACGAHKNQLGAHARMRLAGPPGRSPAQTPAGGTALLAAVHKRGRRQCIMHVMH